MSHTSFEELSQSLAGLSKSLVQQVESMNTTVLAAMEASRKGSHGLVKKNQALQAALLAKSSEVAAAATSQVSVKPSSFTDHLVGGVVKLTVFDRELHVHRSILSSIPFFEAKLEHWRDEPVKLPEEVTEPAFDNLLMRRYVGAPLPAGNVVLCAQVIHLAKYWLLDAIVTEMVLEVLQMARKEDVLVLDELAKRFEIEELSLAVERLQKEPLCSSQELEGLVNQACREGGKLACELCTDLLKKHPHARDVLREHFTRCNFAAWSSESLGSKTFHRVRLCQGFQWFWKQLTGAGLLKTDLPAISAMLMSKLNENTGYRVDQLWGSHGILAPSNAALSTLAEAFEACRLNKGKTLLLDPVLDIVDMAAEHLRMGSLQPADLKDALTSMPGHLLSHPEVDPKMAKLLTDLPLAAAREVFQMMTGRLGEVGRDTAAALRKIAVTEA